MLYYPHTHPQEDTPVSETAMEAALQCFRRHWDTQALQEAFWQKVSCSPTERCGGQSHRSHVAQAVRGAQEVLQVSTALPAQSAAALTALWNFLHPGLCIK